MLGVADFDSSRTVFSQEEKSLGGSSSIESARIEGIHDVASLMRSAIEMGVAPVDLKMKPIGG